MMEPEDFESIPTDIWDMFPLMDQKLPTTSSLLDSNDGADNCTSFDLLQHESQNDSPSSTSSFSNSPAPSPTANSNMNFQGSPVPNMFVPVSTPSLIYNPTLDSVSSSSNTSFNTTVPVSSSILEDEVPSSKRRRITTSKAKAKKDTPDVSEVTLSREQMLNFSANQYEDYINAITSRRTLSEAEEDIVRKQRRLVRNRESAQASRTRKRQRIEELEDQVRQVTEEKQQVMNELNKTKGENAALQKATRYLQDLVDRTPLLSHLAHGASSLIEHNPDSNSKMNHGITIKKEKKSSSSSSTKNSQTMGVMMLVVVLACGLFLNAKHPGTSQPLASPPVRLAPLLLHDSSNPDPFSSSPSSVSSSSSASTSSSTSTKLLGSKRNFAEMQSTDLLQPLPQSPPTTTIYTNSSTSTSTTSSSSSSFNDDQSSLDTTTTTTTTSAIAAPTYVVANVNQLQATVDAVRQEVTAASTTNSAPPLIALLIPPNMLSAALFNASQAGYQLLLPREAPLRPM